MRLILLAVLASMTFAFAADPQEVRSSSRTIIGAVQSLGGITIATHLPGYGLHIHAEIVDGYSIDQLVMELEGVVVGLSGLVEGLDEGDFVSISVKGVGGVDTGSAWFDVVTRMVPGDPSTLETFTNGVRQ